MWPSRPQVPTTVDTKGGATPLTTGSGLSPLKTPSMHGGAFRLSTRPSFQGEGSFGEVWAPGRPQAWVTSPGSCLFRPHCWLIFHYPAPSICSACSLQRRRALGGGFRPGQFRDASPHEAVTPAAPRSWHWHSGGESPSLALWSPHTPRLTGPQWQVRTEQAWLQAGAGRALPHSLGSCSLHPQLIHSFVA